MKSRNREFLLLAAFFVGGYFWLFSEKEDLLQKEKSFQFFSTIATNELIKQYPAPPDHLALQSAVVINLQTDYTYLEVQPKKAWPLAFIGGARSFGKANDGCVVKRSGGEACISVWKRGIPFIDAEENFEASDEEHEY